MTEPRLTRRRGAALGSALIAAALLTAPAAAAATPTAHPAETTWIAATETTEGAQACTVTESELTWGFKESFRSYISGSIANGEWTTDNGAEYETPNFIWPNGEGEIASSLDEGTVEYTGSIHFTGHDGALSMTVENPAIEFAADNVAYLLLDFGATDNAEEETAESSLLQVAKIELDGALETDGSQLTITDGIPRLTSEGAQALNGEYGSYAAGDEMDPITMTAAIEGCELGTVTAAPVEPEAEEEAAEPIAAAPEESSIPWIPIAIGAVALLVIGITTGMLVAGRGKGKNSTPHAAHDAPPSE